MELKDFSPEQITAITAQGNVIVSAGAGSGKTTVMIERIVHKLIGGAKLDDMLIVTFTRAAAADIRVKLAERLSKLKRDPETRELAAEAIDAMSVCDIGTLHSFCQRLIKTYFYAAGVDPSATVADENEAALYKHSAVRAAVDAAWTDGSTEFATVYDALSSRRDDNAVSDAVRDILDFALSLPEPLEYLSAQKSDAERVPELDALVSRRRDDIIARTLELKNDIVAADFTALKKAIDDVIPYIDGKIDCMTKTVHRAKGDYRDVINERFKAFKKTCAAFRDFRIAATQAKETDSSVFSGALCRVAVDALERYAAKKAAAGKLDYSDLEHGARRVLADPACKAEIAANIKYVFIDEYQDVNPLQAAIADELKNCAEMFLVGDIKQSIYAFRRCNPKYFKTALADPDYTFVALNRNYRSAPQVIDFINTVFDGIMTDDFGGADYKNERLVCGSAKAADGSADFFVVNVDDPAGVAEDSEKRESKASAGGVYSVVRAAQKRERPDPEVTFTVNSILDWLDTAENPSLGSIAVLVRSMRSEFCGKLAAALDECGIKWNFGRASSVSDYPEAIALLDILRNVDNRFDDVALYTALRSPMGGFSDAELLRIAESGETAAKKAGVIPYLSRKSYSFWQKAAAYDGALKSRLDAFYARRERFALYSESHDCADTMGYITSEIEYFRHVYETGGSAQAVEALIDYAATRRCDVHSFLEYCNSTDFALDFAGGDDAVTITTMHSAKGLEYDFVIVADTAHEFMMSDAYAKIIITENGVCMKYPDPIAREFRPSVPWLIESAEAPDRLRQEELRLFYVALTRAKKKLIVCGKNKKRNSGAATLARSQLDFMSAHLPRVAEAVPRETLKPQGSAAAVDPSIVAAVKSICEFDYKTDDLPIKTCVTALAASSDDGDYTAAAYVLTDDERVMPADGALAAGDARLRGTAYHRAMELAEFSSPDFDRLEAECEGFAALVDKRKIATAAATMAKLVSDCAFYCKERYFIVDMPADMLGVGESDESVLVQGVIDLLIVGGDGSATVVDYKTTAPEKLLCDEYSKQLRLYAAAVERTTPYKVQKKYLYSFALERLIEIS